MVQDNFPAEVHPDTDGLGGRLGGEEGVEHLPDDGFLDANPVVVDGDDYVFLCFVGRNRQSYERLIVLPLAFLPQGVDAIGQYAHDGLTELLGVYLGNLD